MNWQVAWDTNAELMRTARGLMLWTAHYHPRGHVFEPMADDGLWLWGFSA